MKKILICLILTTLINVCSINAQSTDSCGTDDMDSTEFINQPWFGNNQYLNDFLDSIGYPKPNTAARIVGLDRVWYHLPIKIWNIRRSNGTGGVDVQTIRNQVLRLNRVFNEMNDTKIGFYTTCDITNLNSDNYYTIGGNGFGAWFVAASLTNNYYQPGVINIYLTGSIGGGVNGITYRGVFLRGLIDV